MGQDLPSQACLGNAPSLYGFGSIELQGLVCGLGEPGFRANQLIGWLYARPIGTFSEMTDIPKPLRHTLEKKYRLMPFYPTAKKGTSDGVLKWAFEIEGGGIIESVYIPGEGKDTLCLSSQAGCALDCAFCATAKVGFRRNLRLEEIVGQLMHAVFELGRPAIRRIVFMGMGEPLLNVENILRAIEIFTLPSGLGFSPSRITVSSSGVVPGIVELSKKAPGVGLAVSLNAPDHERRAKVMSIAKKYPLKDLFEALRAWTRTTKAPVTLEYVLLPGFNMALEDAPKLASLVRGLPCKINLIPFNPFLGASFRPPSDDEVDAFANSLHAKGLRVQIRRSRGLGALAACGQLGAGLLAGPRRLKALSG